MRGKFLAAHKELAAGTGMKVFFATLIHLGRGGLTKIPMACLDSFSPRRRPLPILPMKNFKLLLTLLTTVPESV